MLTRTDPDRWANCGSNSGVVLRFWRNLIFVHPQTLWNPFWSALPLFWKLWRCWVQGLEGSGRPPRSGQNRWNPCRSRSWTCFERSSLLACPNPFCPLEMTVRNLLKTKAFLFTPRLQAKLSYRYIACRQTGTSLKEEFIPFPNQNWTKNIFFPK